MATKAEIEQAHDTLQEAMEVREVQTELYLEKLLPYREARQALIDALNAERVAEAALEVVLTEHNPPADPEVG